MEISALLAICAGNSPVPGEFPSQRPVTRSFDVFLINGWVSNREAGDLRRHRAHYFVIVMMTQTVAAVCATYWYQVRFSKESPFDSRLIFVIFSVVPPTLLHNRSRTLLRALFILNHAVTSVWFRFILAWLVGEYFTLTRTFCQFSFDF